jgi:hypothetical protein
VLLLLARIDRHVRRQAGDREPLGEAHTQRVRRAIGPSQRPFDPDDVAVPRAPSLANGRLELCRDEHRTESRIVLGAHPQLGKGVGGRSHHGPAVDVDVGAPRHLENAVQPIVSVRVDELERVDDVVADALVESRNHGIGTGIEKGLVVRREDPTPALGRKRLYEGGGPEHPGRQAEGPGLRIRRQRRRLDSNAA